MVDKVSLTHMALSLRSLFDDFFNGNDVDNSEFCKGVMDACDMLMKACPNLTREMVPAVLMDLMTSEEHRRRFYERHQIPAWA